MADKQILARRGGSANLAILKSGSSLIESELLYVIDTGDLLYANSTSTTAPLAGSAGPIAHNVGDLLRTTALTKTSFFDPRGVFLQADGQAYPQQSFPALYSVFKHRYFPYGYAPVKTPDPIVLPITGGTDVDWSPNGQYMVVTTGQIVIYDWSSVPPVAVFTGVTQPNIAAVLSVSWSPNGQYMSVGHNLPPYVTTYTWSNGSPVRLSSPASLPSNNSPGVSWSPSGRYLATVQISSPFVAVYDWDSGSPVKIPDPATTPPAYCTDVDWSPNGQYMVVSHSSTPYITIYDWSTGAPVKISNPASLPADIALGVDWSPNGRYMAVSVLSTPFLHVYDWSTGAPVKLTNPVTLPPSDGGKMSWSPDSRYLTVSHRTTPFFSIYDFSTGAPIKIANPGSLPFNSCTSASWSPDGRYTSVSSNVFPYVLTYDNSNLPANTFYLPTIPRSNGVATMVMARTVEANASPYDFTLTSGSGSGFSGLGGSMSRQPLAGQTVTNLTANSTNVLDIRFSGNVVSLLANANYLEVVDRSTTGPTASRFTLDGPLVWSSNATHTFTTLSACKANFVNGVQYWCKFRSA